MRFHTGCARRWCYRNLWLLVCFGVVVSGPVALTAADPEAPTPRVYRGANDCLRCHTAGLPKMVDPALAALGFGGGQFESDNWVLYEELKIWATNDKHAQAYTSLLNEQSRRMGAILGIKEIHRDKRCLACHTGFPIHDMTTEAADDDPHLMPKAFESNLRVTQGVSCEACHGPSGDAVIDGEQVAGWFVPHASKENWRFLSQAEKYEKYHFFDVRTRVSRTKICASCHIGDAAAGRVVTHEMYAAGHPPLPGLEIETFIDQMPKHWRDFGEKEKNVRDEFLQKAGENFNPEALARTKSLLVGAAVVAGESLKLAADLTAGEFPEDIAKPAWPELAQFECFACHHDLKERGWRQTRLPGVTPGRPLLREWQTALAVLAVEFSGEETGELEARLTAVNSVLNSRPFGEAKQLAAAARAAHQWLEAVAWKLEEKEFSRDDGMKLLSRLGEIVAETTLDYDSARQVVWAFGVIEREVNPEGESELRTALKMLGGEMFYLDLREGREAKQQVPGAQASRDVFEVDIAKVLAPVSAYDPRIFRERFAEIAAFLNSK